MLEKILDLHIHSKYSRACSKDLDLNKIAFAAEKKGVDIISTGDFTHPLWYKSIREELVEKGDGIYSLNQGNSKTRFILGTEVACIYKDKGKVRRIHLLIFSPGIEVAGKFNKVLEEQGVNLRSDGRPIMGISSKDLLKICLSIDDRIVMVPAHVWTPWFGLFGSKSGYDDLEDCFEELSLQIFALETGLSSDPVMNRRIKRLDTFTLISNSDAHSLEKIGREANEICFNKESSLSYGNLWDEIRAGRCSTIEFYPQEGMYFNDGHRDCDINFNPADTNKSKGLCPKCNKELTVGVLNRVDHFADRSLRDAGKISKCKYSIPLKQLIASVYKMGVGSKKVCVAYELLVRNFGNEMRVQFNADLQQISMIDKKVAMGIKKMREGRVEIIPGYDGKYGKINL